MDNATKRGAPARPQRAGDGTLLQDVLFLLLRIVLIVLAFVMMFTCVYGLHRSTDASMSPAIHAGDLLLYYRWDKTYAAGDTLVLNAGGQTQARRVVATAGDTVDITEEGLVINGALQQEPEIYQQTARFEVGIAFPLAVGQGQVFVLGDARENAVDSRLYGLVEVDATLGKVVTILWRRNV